MNTDKHKVILQLVKLVNKKPNPNCDYFYLSANERSMIIDLDHMENLTPTLAQLSKLDKKYLFVDILNPKILRYYGFNIDPETQNFADEKEGEIFFSLVEDSLLKFFEENILEISKFDTPYSELYESLEKESTPSKVSSMQTTYSNPPCQQYNRPVRDLIGTGYDWRENNPTYKNFGSSVYKDREAFQDAVYALVKNNKTGEAVDYINDFMSNKNKEDKELLNSIFRFISLDKMDLLSGMALIKSTENMKYFISERNDLIDKYKGLAYKASPRKNNRLYKEARAYGQ
jgi:hypothetical protein